MESERKSVLVVGGSGYTGQFVTHHFASLGYKVGVYTLVKVKWQDLSKYRAKEIACMQVVYTHYSTAAPYAAGEDVEAKWVRIGVPGLFSLMIFIGARAM